MPIYFQILVKITAKTNFLFFGHLKLWRKVVAERGILPSEDVLLYFGLSPLEGSFLCNPCKFGVGVLDGPQEAVRVDLTSTLKTWRDIPKVSHEITRIFARIYKD